MTKLSLSITALVVLFAGCGEETPVPKPPTYLRYDFPKHAYQSIGTECPYTFELSTAYSYTNAMQDGKMTCHKDIDLGPLNGTISFSYIEMDRPLKDYVEYALSKVEEHQVKAEHIDDEHVIRPGAKVYGTFFELKGDVASPFQFYLTDSTSRFVSGMVYFNSRPNYDSLKPSLEYLKQDLKHLMETFEWK